MIITIDGPAGTGKSTVARRLANRLGFAFLDTGAMYRAVAWLALELGVDLAEQENVGNLAKNIPLSFDKEQVLVGEIDVTQLIRSPEVTQAASRVAANQLVREVLVAKQKEIGKQGDLVTEGRDQGTVVFPESVCKFFLTASAEVRAQRRYDELLARGDEADYSAILNAQVERDYRDQNRVDSPLKPADDSFTVDTSKMTLDEVVEYLFHIAQQKII